MLKNLLSLVFVALSLNGNAQRYLTEIFTDADLTISPGVVYANNFQFLTGAPVSTDLKMDIYAPNSAIDPVDARPLIIYLHTGSFLPPVVNGTPTGWQYDSTVVEMCKQFARRGYVAAALAYRVGWNPVALDQDVRTGTLLQAVYRAIQDAKAGVRFFYKSAASTNQYEIDSTKIILGGQGSGGYIALAYATLDKTSEIELPKFLSGTTNTIYDFVAGQSYINQNIMGDFEGFGGDPTKNNGNNSVGFSSTIHFVFNMGGALGDSSWMEPGDAPMVAFHVIGDPFAPYGNGPVIVPTTGQFVVNVSGSSVAIAMANAMGNNNCFNAAAFSDPYTLRANSLNNGEDGLFPFETNPTVSAGPWEWFDSTATVMLAQAFGLPAAQGTQAYMNGLMTNNDMSKSKALAYIDTIQNYVNPRIVYCLGLTAGVNENALVAASLSAMPNPSSDKITISLNQENNVIKSISVFDFTGRKVLLMETNNEKSVTIKKEDLEPGIYIANVKTLQGTASVRLLFN